MTEAVVEVGPGTVRGPNAVDPQWVAAALDGIDDDIVLIDEQPVAVDDVWHEVMRAVANVDTIVAVCPGWWPSARIDRVCAAARRVATAVIVLNRTQVLAELRSNPRVPIVEIAPEFVVVTRESVTSYLPHDDPGAVVAAVGGAPAALVDAPVGLTTVRPLSAVIAQGLRVNGTAVSYAGDVLPPAAAMRAETPARAVGPSRRIPRAPALAGLVTAAVLSGGFALRGAPPAADIATAVLVEGRVAVSVPAHWTLERITSGPGSARVQVVSPIDADIALHVTQAAGAHGGLAAAAEALRVAFDAEADGVFVDFDSDTRVAGRQAVTYREIRGDRHIAWAVVVDGDVRIAIGCQSAPGRDAVVRDVCERAVRSAHALR